MPPPLAGQAVKGRSVTEDNREQLERQRTALWRHMRGLEALRRHGRISEEDYWKKLVPIHRALEKLERALDPDAPDEEFIRRIVRDG